MRVSHFSCAATVRSASGGAGGRRKAGRGGSHIANEWGRTPRLWHAAGGRRTHAGRCCAAGGADRDDAHCDGPASRTSRTGIVVLRRNGRVRSSDHVGPPIAVDPHRKSARRRDRCDCADQTRRRDCPWRHHDRDGREPRLRFIPARFSRMWSRGCAPSTSIARGPRNSIGRRSTASQAICSLPPRRPPPTCAQNPGIARKRACHGQYGHRRRASDGATHRRQSGIAKRSRAQIRDDRSRQEARAGHGAQARKLRRRVPEDLPRIGDDRAPGGCADRVSDAPQSRSARTGRRVPLGPLFNPAHRTDRLCADGIPDAARLSDPDGLRRYPGGRLRRSESPPWCCATSRSGPKRLPRA